MISTKKDGRIILTGKDYTEFRLKMHLFQFGLCHNCAVYTNLSLEPGANLSFHVHHKNGRGMGGGKRDDTFKACVGLCGACHRKEHGQ